MSLVPYPTSTFKNCLVFAPQILPVLSVWPEYIGTPTPLFPSPLPLRLFCMRTQFLVYISSNAHNQLKQTYTVTDLPGGKAMLT